MIELLSLVGGGLGGLLRFVPEIFKIVNQKNENAHEFKMTELQLKVDQARSAQQIDLVNTQSNASEIALQGQAYLEAIKGQSQLTGVRWVDGLNATVRPFLTYWWMSIFTAYKITIIYDAWITSSSVIELGSKIWTTNDCGILSMILGFWFVDRVFKHNK